MTGEADLVGAVSVPSYPVCRRFYEQVRKTINRHGGSHVLCSLEAFGCCKDVEALMQVEVQSKLTARINWLVLTSTDAESACAGHLEIPEDGSLVLDHAAFRRGWRGRTLVQSRIIHACIARASALRPTDLTIISR